MVTGYHLRVNFTNDTNKNSPKNERMSDTWKMSHEQYMLLLFWQQLFENNFQKHGFEDGIMAFICTDRIYVYHSFLLSHSCHFIQFNHESLSFNMINKVIPKQLQAKTNKMSLGR